MSPVKQFFLTFYVLFRQAPEGLPPERSDKSRSRRERRHSSSSDSSRDSSSDSDRSSSRGSRKGK